MPFFLLHPTSVEVAKTFINDLRSSATGNQFRLECVSTPPAVARTRSSSAGILYKARWSHSSPSETAPRWSSSNLAADASSTYSMEHTATTKQPSSYIFFPLLMHINEIITHRSTTSQTNMGMITMQFSRSHGQPLQRPKEMQQMLKIFVCRSLVLHKHDAMSHKHANSVTKTTHVTTHFLVEPNLRGGFQDFHQRVAQLCYRQPIPVGMCLHTTRSSQNSKRTSWHFRQRTPQPLLALWNSSKAKFFQFGSRCLFHLRHPTHCHHKTTIILQHRTMWQRFKFGHKNNSCHNTCFGWTQPPWRVPRLSSTSCAALLQAAKRCPVVSPHQPQ